MNVYKEKLELEFKPIKICLNITSVREAQLLKQFFGNLPNQEIVEIANRDEDEYDNFLRFDVKNDINLIEQFSGIYNLL